MTTVGAGAGKGGTGEDALRQHATAPSAAPPSSLVRHWIEAGIVAPGARWLALAGGRTNAIWQVAAPQQSERPSSGASPDRTVTARDADGHDASAAPRNGHPETVRVAAVCKLYRPGSDTPLFANDAAAERRALLALEGTGLAPRLLAAGETDAGASLVYAHVAGRPWRCGQDDPAAVGRALARLHAVAPPKGLPQAPCGTEAWAAQARAIAAELTPERRAELGPQPDPSESAPAPTVFLHGDATAGNALVTAGGITFIDWQCPAVGDPVVDLATFLSPAMQAMSGNAPLTPAQEQAFLAGYGDATVVDRCRALAPMFHWRMAAYCLWRAARGEAGYAEAARLELERLR